MTDLTRDQIISTVLSLEENRRKMVKVIEKLPPREKPGHPNNYRRVILFTNPEFWKEALQ